MAIKRAVIYGVILELVLGMAAAAFYFLYYVHTPTYTLKEIQKSMQTGDTEGFLARVDLEKIFQQQSIELSQIVPRDSSQYEKLASGSFGKTCQEDFLKYLEKGKWEETENPNEDNFFQDKIGFKSMVFQEIVYVQRDAVEEGEEATATEPTATAGIKIYEPNAGDSFIIQLKLRQLEDKSWFVYGVVGYKEFVDTLIKQNDRDMKRYREKVKRSLQETEMEFAELRATNPEITLDWILSARKIMEKSDAALKELDTPVASGYLGKLLQDRQSIFVNMLDEYYEKISIEDKLKTYQENANNTKGMPRQKPYKKTALEKDLAEENQKIATINGQWAANKANLEKVLGTLVTPKTQATKKGGIPNIARNNDDEIVRRANYPTGASEGSEANSVLGGESLPVVSLEK